VELGTERADTASSRRRDRNRQAILDAALALIEVSGVDGWSMRKLADRVEYTPGALYRYFDGKAALLDTLTSDAMDQLRSRMAQTSPEGGPLARLEALGLAYLAFATEQPTLFRLGLIAMPSRRTSAEQQPGSSSPYTVLIDEVRAALNAGLLTSTATFGAEEIAYTIWATVHGMAVLEQTHLRGFDADFATTHREALQRLLHGMAATPAGPQI
jgi:AcrR family transcriptional regulator